MDRFPTLALAERGAASDISSTITVLNATRDPARDAATAATVDCFRNLTASVTRFVLMLLDARGIVDKPRSFAEMTLKGLAILLVRHARAVGFARMPDLVRAVEAAAAAEEALYRVLRTSSGSDPARLNELARQWEQLDATFVGLCVEHVMQGHDGVRITRAAPIRAHVEPAARGRVQRHNDQISRSS